MKHKLTALALVTLAAITAVFAISDNVVHAAGSIFVTGGTVNVNSNIVVNVRADTGGINVNSAQVRLQYDTSKLQYVGYSTNGAPIASGANYASSGNIFAGGAYNADTPANGSNILIVAITFKALVGSGSTSLQLLSSNPYATGLGAADGSGSIGASLVNGTVNFTTPTCAAGQTGTWPNCVTPTPPSTPTSPSAPSAPAPSAPSSSSTPNTPSASTPNTPSTPSSTPSAETPTDEVTTPNTDLITSIKIGFFDKNHKPLKKKKVTLHSAPQTQTTDNNGYAVFTNVPIGTHEAQYAAGSKTYTQTLIIANSDTRTIVYDFKQSSFPWWGWFLALLVAVGAAIGIFISRRRPMTTGVSASPTAQAGNVGSSAGLGSENKDDDLMSRLNQIPTSQPLPPGSVVEPTNPMKEPEDKE